MKRLLVMVCLSGSTVRAQPAAEPAVEPASDTGGFAAARLGMQASVTVFGDAGKSPVIELELGRRWERWLAFSTAASFTSFEDHDFDADQELLYTRTRLVDGRVRATFILDDPSTAAHAGLFAGIGFGVIHTHREGVDTQSGIGPLGELFVGFDRAIGRHIAFTFMASVGVGAGFLGRACAGVELY